MATDFEPARAIRDELRSLADLDRTISNRETTCEAQLTQAEVELNALRKIRGFVKIQMEKARAKLYRLEQER